MAMIGKYVNETELRKAILQLFKEGDLFEVRIIENSKKKPLSGYFKDVETLLTAFEKVDLRNTNVYVTLHCLKDELYARQQSDHFLAGANSTQDSEVIGYEWLFIDLDPVRPTGISSSDAELQEAYKTARLVVMYLKDHGFEEPVKGISGNGAHLLYKIQLRNNEENKTLVERCLKALAMLFDNEKVKVDVSNFNPSRVCKLYGTLAQKGTNKKDRPFRFSRIIGDVKDIKPTDKVYLERLAAELPDEVIKPTRLNNYNTSEFDVEDWMSGHGIKYKALPFKGGTKYILDECPFDHSHTAPDSMVTKSSTGALGFKCLHNSCADKHWKELRLLLEPDAYDHDYSEDDRRIEEGWKQHNRDKQLNAEAKPYTEGSTDEPMFLTAKMISEIKEPDSEYIKTGFNVIDKRMKGLEKGSVSLISGLRGAAKSTLLGQIILNCVQAGHTSVVYSGELSSSRFMRWLYMQAAGKGYTKKYKDYDSFYCMDEVKPAIDDWLGDKMWLYNNNYGNNFKQISTQLKKIILEHKADLCVIDNLMALDLSISNPAEKNDAQTAFVWTLKEIARECNIHIIFVAHPRKAQGFLRLDDISGSGNISNIVDNAFIIHRNNADFKRLTQKDFKWSASHDAYSGDNVIEVCKDREGGLQDEFIPLWYEKESKRLLNYYGENPVYTWSRPWVDAAPDEIPF
jgi:archaellum biogenesis ATPase FlaH